MLGMLLMALEQLQPRLQQRLQLGVLGRGDQQRLKRAVDLLVVGDLVVDIGLVECRAVELGKLGALSSAAASLSALLVALSSGVTFSFLTRSSACTFTASWSRTMSSARIR